MAEADQSNMPLANLEWITLYDFINIMSKVSIDIRINNFFESFYPLKYKFSVKKDVTFKPYYKDGLLGGIALAISKILYSFELFLASQLEICSDQNKQMKNMIRLSQIAIQIQQHYLQDSMKVESLMNMITEIALEMNKTNKDSKTFLENKLMCILFRLYQFFVWFQSFYKGDQEAMGAINTMFKLLNRIILNAKKKASSQLTLFKQINTLIQGLLKYFQTNVPQNFDTDFIRSLQSICNAQKKTISLLNQIPMVNALKYLDQQVPKDIVDSYMISQAQINNLISQQQQDVDPILIAERIRNSSNWRNIIHGQLINLTVQKLIKNPSKILLMDEFKKSNGFPLFKIP